jgi:hypothetical protein
MASTRATGLQVSAIPASGQIASDHVDLSEEAVIAASHEDQAQPLWKSSGWSGRHSDMGSRQ